MNQLKRYTWPDGFSITSYLPSQEVVKRMNRLDNLRVLTEGYTEGEGRSICQKALRAYNKTDNFTGIIRLTLAEKDFLGYMLESDMLDDEDIETIEYYIRTW